MSIINKLINMVNNKTQNKGEQSAKQVYLELDKQVFKGMAKLEKKDRNYILFSEFPEGSENITPMYNTGYSKEGKGFALTKINIEKQTGYKLYH